MWCLCWKPCWAWDFGFWKRWTRPVLASFAAVWLLTAQGCSSPSSPPALPVLTSLQRLELHGTPGLWMDSGDAGRLAAWIYDVTGETGGDAW